MTQRDQLVGALGRLDARDPRDADDVSLGRVTGHHQLRGLRRYADQCPRDGAARRHVLFGDIDHLRAPLGVQVGQIVQGAQAG